MKKVIRLTESDLTRIVKRVIMEQETDPVKCLTNNGFKSVDPTNTKYSKISDDGSTEFYGKKDNTWTYYKKNINGKVDQQSVKQNVNPCE